MLRFFKGKALACRSRGLSRVSGMAPKPPERAIPLRATKRTGDFGGAEIECGLIEAVSRQSQSEEAAESPSLMIFTSNHYKRSASPARP